MELVYNPCAIVRIWWGHVGWDVGGFPHRTPAEPWAEQLSCGGKPCPSLGSKNARESKVRGASYRHVRAACVLECALQPAACGLRR